MDEQTQDNDAGVSQSPSDEPQVAEPSEGSDATTEAPVGETDEPSTPSVDEG